jgi:hypothetical protein
VGDARGGISEQRITDPWITPNRQQIGTYLPR